VEVSVRAHSAERVRMKRRRDWRGRVSDIG
jgi:hypothetical protein